jgi:hypothetical protein
MLKAVCVWCVWWTVSTAYAQKQAVLETVSVTQAVVSTANNEICPTQSWIRDVAVTAPSPGAVLKHEDLVYVQGTALDVAFTAPDCQEVKSVTLGGRPLYVSGTCIDCDRGTYKVQSKTFLSTGLWRFVVRMYFDNARDGASSRVEITLGNKPWELVLSRRSALFETPVAKTSFTKVNVKNVGGPQTLTVSQVQMQDAFTQSIWDMYGADGRYTDPGADLSSTSDDGRTLYSPSYPVGLEIKQDGVHFSWSTKASVENWCDPKVSFKGTFVLDHDFEGVYARWTQGLEVSLDYSWICDVGGAVIGIFYDLGESMIKSSIESQMEDSINGQIREAFQSDCGGFSCSLFVQNIVHQQGYVDIVFNFPGDAVQVEVPYGVHKMNNTYARFALHPQDKVVLIGGGMASLEKVEGAYAPGGYVYASPTGTYSQNNVFLQASSGGEQARVYNGLHVVSRAPSGLPKPSRNVGLLLARMWRDDVLLNTSLLEVGNTSRVQMPACGASMLSFGVNDSTKDAGQFYAKGVGTFTVSVLWPPGGVASVPQRASLPCMAEQWGVEVLAP